jgi:hypothetical protein
VENKMTETYIRPLRFEELEVSEFEEMLQLLTHTALTPEKAQAIGLGKPFDELIAQIHFYSTLTGRNKTFVETEPLVNVISKLRRQMGLLSSTLRVILANDEANAEAARVISNMAKPHLKGHRKSSMIGLLGNGVELCYALEDAEIAPLVTQLDLTKQLTFIHQLTDEGNRLLTIRSQEQYARKTNGTASKTKRRLQKQLRNLFSSLLPSIYQLTNDPNIKTTVTDISNHINATLDSFRHLAQGSE